MKKSASKPAAAVVATPPATVTITRSTAPRKGSSIVYVIPGLRATVKVARAAFEGAPPDALVISGAPFAAAKVPILPSYFASA